jgi:hypothetical protein
VCSSDLGNTRILSEQIVHFLENPERIAEMGQKARETAEEWPIQRALQIIYQEVLPESDIRDM